MIDEEDFFSECILEYPTSSNNLFGLRFESTYDDGHCVYDNKTKKLYHMDNAYITEKMTGLLNSLHCKVKILEKKNKELNDD